MFLQALWFVKQMDFCLPRQAKRLPLLQPKHFQRKLLRFIGLRIELRLKKESLSAQQMTLAEEDLLVVAEVLENSIENYKRDIMQRLGKFYAQFKKAIFLGRHISYPFGLEAALKLKEISYIFAQCYPAGELKHGPLHLLMRKHRYLFSPIQIHLFIKNYFLMHKKLKRVMAIWWPLLLKGNMKCMALADQSFILPRVKPLLGPLAMTGLMQFFVIKLQKNWLPH